MQPEPQEVGTQRRFSTAVCERIQFYVYVLRDPRDCSIFYVGKGTGNRVFEHADEAIDSPKATDKLDRIRAIHAERLLVEYQIVRHGMTEEQAFEVESALIDWIGIGGLANAVVGHHANNRGMMSVDEIIAVYDARPVTIDVPAFIVTVNRKFERGVQDERLYEISRGNWVMGPRREQAKYCISAYRGLVRAVYRVESWEPVPPKPGARPRWRFHGTVADELRHLIGGDITAILGPSSQNPVRYVNCRM
jgi:hypothetical protein